MDIVTISIIVAFAILFVLLFSGIPIAWSMLLAAIGGFAILGQVGKGLNLAAFTGWSLATRESLICIPLYLLMGNLLYTTGMIGKLFDFAMAIFSKLKLKGGLAMAVVLASGIFGAVSGSIAAAISTFGPVVVGEAEKNHYNKNFLASVLAMSGSMAALIPPSLNLILFGIITEVSIAKLFMAGIIPGVLLMVLYCITIYVIVSVKPTLGASQIKSVSYREIGSLSLNNFPVMVIIFIVLGGIYLGWFTPTESSAAGVVAVALLAVILRRLNVRESLNSITRSAVVFGMILILLTGAFTLAGFVSLSQSIALASHYIAEMGLGAYGFLAMVFVLFLIIGCAIGSAGIMVLSLPILFPIAMSLDIDPIMFGIFCNVSVAIAEVTPPVALNIYLMQGVARDPEITSVGMMKLVWPYLIAAAFITLLIVIFPQLCTWLPNTMSY